MFRLDAPQLSNPCRHCESSKEGTMRMLRSLGLRIAGLLRPTRAEEESRLELESHIAMHMDEGIRAGLTAAEASSSSRTPGTGSARSSKEGTMRMLRSLGLRIAGLLRPTRATIQQYANPN